MSITKWHQIGWHRVNGFHRCCRCLQAIPKGERYYGSANEPGRILCFGCKTGHKQEVRV